MWVFDLLDASGAVSVTVPLLEGSHTLGRKGSSISFPEDRSVSRKHAEVRVGPVPRNDPSKQPVWVKDVGSKLKTLVNGVETGEANREVHLKEGDEVKVGTTGSIMRLRFQPLRLCGTLLLAEDKVQLKALSKKCGGVMATRKWDPATSTHLVTPPSPTSVTEKLVLAALAVKPAVHMGWLRALAEAGAAKPLKPVPDATKFAPVVTRGRQGSFLVQVNHARRTALSNDVFVALRKNDLVEKIVEGAGGDLVRAYEMSDADFAGQDWRARAGGRSAHFIVEALPDEPLPAKSEAVLNRRVETLEGAGMEATDKQQLAEAVVYLQDLTSVRESMAMRASSSSAAAMAMHTASEAWGPSQSLAASAAGGAASAPSQAAAVPSMPPPTGSGGIGKRNSGDARALPRPDKPDPLPPPPAVDLGAVPPPKTARTTAEATGAVGAAEAAAADNSKAAAEEISIDGGGGGGGGRGVPERGPGNAAATAKMEDKRSSSKKRGREEAEEASGDVGDADGSIVNRGDSAAAPASAAPAPDAGKDGNPRASAAARARRVGRDDVDANPDATAIAAAAIAAAAERVGKEAAGMGASVTGDDVVDDGSEGYGDGAGGAQAMVKTGYIDGIGADDARAEGQGNDGGSESAGERAAKRKKQDERHVAAEEADEVGGGSRTGSQNRPPVTVVPGGWMTAHNASSRSDIRRKAGKKGGVSSQGQRASGAQEDAADDELDEEERLRLATPLEAAVTEKCRLVVKVLTARSASRGYSGIPRRGGAGGASVPNFKRFKKNTIMFGGEQSPEYVPLAALRSTLPKESERELALAEEQQRLEEEEADADRLFTQAGTGRGVKARVPQGRTKRR